MVVIGKGWMTSLGRDVGRAPGCVCGAARVLTEIPSSDQFVRIIRMQDRQLPSTKDNNHGHGSCLGRRWFDTVTLRDER